MNEEIQQDFQEIDRLARYLDRFLDEESGHLASSILASTSRLQILHGRHGSGKSTLIRDHLLARLEAAAGGEVYYAACDPGFPRSVATRAGATVAIGEVIQRRGAIVVIDDFDRYLARGEVTATAPESLFEHFETVTARIVLVVDDDHLSSVFDFRRLEPKCVDAVFPVGEIDVGVGLNALAEADVETHFVLGRDLIDALRADVQALAEGVSTELLAILYYQFRVFHFESDRKPEVLKQEHYLALGGLIGILRRHVRSALEHMEQSGDGKRRNMAGAILREIVGASMSGRPVDFGEVCRRLDVDEQTYRQVLEQLSRRPGLVREIVPGVYSVSPPQLMHGIREHLAELAEKLEGPRRVIDEGCKNWEQLGLLLPEDRFQEVNEQRKLLLLSEKAAELMLRCSLVYDSTEETTSYWHQRLNDPPKALGIFLEHLSHRFDDVRVRAATLLGSYAEEARNQLHLIALQDKSDTVSDAAIAALARAPTDELRRLLSQEAREQKSPYRQRAVGALRMFHDPETSAALRDLVNDPRAELRLRVEAIRSLAAQQTQSGVDALVDIALDDEDADDRKNAASALAATEPALNEHLLQRLRDPRPKAARSAARRLLAGLRGFILFVVAGLVAVGAVLVPGLPFAVMRRWRVLGVLVLVEAIAIWFLTPFGLLLQAVALLLGLSVAAGMLLAGLRDGSVPEGSLRHWLCGWLLFLLGAVSMFTVHGLGHLLVRRWLRATGLFILELLGAVTLGLLDVPVFSTLISRSDLLSSSLSDTGRTLFLAGGWALFLGSFLFDFGLVVQRWLLFPAHSRNRSRLDLILQAVVPNPSVAEKLLVDLRAGGRAKARWSADVLARYGRMIAGDQLVRRLEKAHGAELRCVVRSLRRVDSDVTVSALTRLYSPSTSAVRVRIERILGGAASPRALRALAGLWDELSWVGKLRYYVASFTLPFRIVPRAATVIMLLAAPLFIGFVWEAWRAMSHPELALFARLDSGGVDLGFSSADTFVSTLERRSALATAAAIAFPHEATPALSRTLRRTATLRPPWTASGEEADRANAAIVDHRSKLVESVTQAAIASLQNPLEGTSGASEGMEAAERALAETRDESELPGELATAVHVAQLNINAHQGDERGVAEVIGVSDWENAPAWREPIAALAETEQNAALEALRTLGTELARNALIHIVLAQDDRPFTRANNRRASDVDVKDMDFRRRALDLLGDLGDDANERAALQQIAAELEKTDSSSTLLAAAQRQLYTDLRTKLDAYDFESVIDEGERRLQESAAPDFVLLNLVGRAYHGIGNCESSVERLESAGDRLDPDGRFALVDCYDSLAHERLESQQAAEAIAYVDKALALDDTMSFVHATRALALVRAGFADEAFSAAEAAIRSGADEWDAYEALTEAAEATEDWAGAEAVLLAADQTRSLPRDFLAFVYHEGRALDDDEYFQKAHALRAELREEFGDPIDDNVEANYIETCLTTERYDEAVRLARQLLERPDLDATLEVPMRLALYLALVLAGDRSEPARNALESLGEAVAERGGDLRWTYSGLAHFLTRKDSSNSPLGRLTEAVFANAGTSSRDLEDALQANREWLASVPQ